MRADTAQRDPERRDALLRALDRAARVAGNPARHEEIAAILARPDYLGKPAEVIARAMSGRLSIAAGRDTDRPRPDFLLFYRDAANYPWVSQALWLYSQMVRWGHAELTPEGEPIVREVFQQQHYRRPPVATGPLLPGAMLHVDGTNSM